MPVKQPQEHRYFLSLQDKKERELFEYYVDHPVEFVEDMIFCTLGPDNRPVPRLDASGVPYQMHHTQKAALQALADGKWPIISAGRGVGKTAILSWAQIWWMYTRPSARIPVISVKQDQLKRNVWPEIFKWLDGSLLRSDFVWEKTRVFLVNKEQKVFSFMMSGVTKESFQGVHDDFLLSQSDEGSGIPDEVFEAMLGSLTGPMNAAMIFGNPTQSSGFFIETFEHPTGKWVPIHIPCVDEKGVRHPNVTQEFIDYHKKKYGEDSSPYRVYVLGLKPNEAPNTLIPWEWIKSAESRDVQNTGIYRVVWGLDVARFGDDHSALAKRQGNHLLEPVKTWAGKDTMQLAGLIKMEYEDTPEAQRPSEILVDVIGIGAGVVDRCRESGLPVRGVNVSEAGSVQRQYRRMRDELWWRVREWFETRAVSMPEDGDLRDELSAMKYDTTPDGKIVAQSKSDFKKDHPLIGSPDRADAFVLTFAGGLDRIEDHQIDKYRKHRKPQMTSWLAA